MKKISIILAAAVILVACIFAGCNSNVGNDVSELASDLMPDITTDAATENNMTGNVTDEGPSMNQSLENNTTGL